MRYLYSRLNEESKFSLTDSSFSYSSFVFADFLEVADILKIEGQREAERYV